MSYFLLSFVDFGVGFKVFYELEFVLGCEGAFSQKEPAEELNTHRYQRVINLGQLT